MPHYADGSEAKLMDLVVGKNCSGQKIEGYVVGIIESDTCNLTIGYLTVTASVKPDATGKKWLPEYSSWPQMHPGGQTANAKDCIKLVPNSLEAYKKLFSE